MRGFKRSRIPRESVGSEVAESAELTIPGGLDSPKAGASVDATNVEIVGWAFAPDLTISTIDLYIEGQRIARAGLGRPRPDVAVAAGDLRASICGFEFIGALPASTTQGVNHLAVVITLLDGRTVNWPPVEVMIERPRNLIANVDSRPVKPSKDRTARTPGAPRILISARGLDQGGSQLRMAELVDYLSRTAGFEVTVASDTDGPLRTALENSGASIRIVERAAMDSWASYEKTIAEWREWVDGHFDLIVGATITCFPLVDLGQRLGLPTVMRLGESEVLTTVLHWIFGPVDRRIDARARKVISNTDAVVSLAHSAVATYRADGIDARYVVLSTGVDLASATSYRLSHDRNECRRQLGVDPAQTMLLYAAALWSVKCQTVLVAALDHVRRQHPELVLFLVGGVDPWYSGAIATYVEATGLQSNVRVVAHREDLSDYWSAADVAVCASESEALPAAVLEAMSYSLPVASTDVGDVAALLRPGINGWLVEPRDLGAMISMLDDVATTSPERLRSMGEESRKVAASHDRLENHANWTAVLQEAMRRGS